MVTRIKEVARELDIAVNVQVQLADGFEPPVGYLGSPTILINDVDFDPAARDASEWHFG
ncbi:MAG: hypothetical protein H8E25_13625 [Planctomycetes bacterium]|nr:hypothetical protein [Planctomycetota bacterium]